MKKIWPKIALLILCCSAIAFELWHFRSSSSPAQQDPAKSSPAAGIKQPFVLLPTNEAMVIAHFFAGSKASVEPWEPTLGDMNDVEANLGQIPTLSQKYPENRRISTAMPYYRQYGAAIIDGRKSIVVNAFCPSEQDKSDKWRKHLILVSDGGKCFWKALFDVSTQKFTELSVNGLA